MFSEILVVNLKLENIQEIIRQTNKLLIFSTLTQYLEEYIK